MIYINPEIRDTNANIYKVILILLNNDLELREKVLKKVLKVYYNLLNVFNKKESNTLLTFNEKNDFEICLLKGKSMKNIEHYPLYRYN